MVNPRISANKLGEYIEAGASRRKKIVEDTREPKTFLTSRYKDAVQVLESYIASGYDPAILHSGITAIGAKETSSDFQEGNKRLCIEVLEKYFNFPLPDLSEFTIEKYRGANEKVIISGVEVSVNPNLILRGVVRGQNVVGAIKIHNSKGHQLGEEGRKVIATLLKEFLERYVAIKDEKVLSKNCISVDTFSATFDKAPKSFKRRMKQVESACEEIRLRWNS